MRPIRVLFVAATLVGVVLSGVAARGVAQDRPPPTAHPLSEYGGVTPGGPNPPPATRRLARGRSTRRRAVIVTWPGFQQRAEGASRFFVQTTEPVTATARRAEGRVEIVFASTGIHLSNSGRWLETRHFETPVERARLERRGRDMVLVMYMRGDLLPSISSEVGPNGFFFTYIDFGPGHWRPADPGPLSEPAGSVGVVRAGPSPSPTPSPAPPVRSATPDSSMDDERPPVRSGPSP